MPDGGIRERHPELWSPMERARFEKYGTIYYKPEYALMAYRCLAESDRAATLAHLTKLLLTSTALIIKWRKQYPEFDEAITDGLKVGEARWRDLLADHAFCPSAGVNNGLIKLISGNVYNLKDEPSVVINNTNFQGDPESVLKKRGIPIPQIGIDDVSDEPETDEENTHIGKQDTESAEENDG